MKTIHGKVVFDSDSGRITSTQARGNAGKSWVEELLFLYGILHGLPELKRVSVKAEKRVARSDREEARRRKARKGKR